MKSRSRDGLAAKGLLHVTDTITRDHRGAYFYQIENGSPTTNTLEIVFTRAAPAFDNLFKDLYWI